VRAYVSLWSADLLAVRDGIRLVEGVADGFHVDVFDGHNVPDLLFGPDFVVALRNQTDALIDVHLNVNDPDFWAERLIGAGADMVTVQPAACPEARTTLRRIAEAGARPGLGLEVGQPLAAAEDLLDEVDRVLVMGTRLGIKAQALDPGTPDRVHALRQACDRSARRPEIVVDGGIRRHTVPELAAAGADGVVPGSLVFADPDPPGAVRWIHTLSEPAPATRIA
jgi:ribulose-phosphate 3-epimerase